MDNKKLIIAIFITLLLNMIFFLEFNRMQMKDIFRNANDIASNLENKLHNSIKAVEYLHLAALHIFNNKEKIKLHKALNIKYINENGSYALDSYEPVTAILNKEINLLGFGKTTLSEKKTLQEMEAALRLAPFLKLIYIQNKNFAWVYYYSKNHFTVLYPYISSKDFNFTPALEKKPFYHYATPKVNPQKKLFFTPLYMDAIGKGLMVTVGKPLYYHNKFMGTLDVDITLNNFDNALSRLDYFDNQIAIYNEKNQIVASHNMIRDFNRSKIYKINNFVAPSILNIQETLDSVQYTDSKYIFVKTLPDSQFRFIYIASAYTIWLKSLIYTFPVFMLMLLSFYLICLYQKSKNTNEKLKLQTVKDYMTGAYNRRYFFEVARALFSRAKRKNTKLAVIMIDIDNFKAINDTYGHDIGDLAIIEVRKVLERNLRKYDLFARFGGEEFCALLDDISKEDVEKLFEKIRKDFENNRITSGDMTIGYTVSFGIAYGMMSSLEKFIKVADEALYTSKQNGKNQVTIYEV
ncbi:sensor domain-containing diguanylate cyclase [Sulfurimonas autotrophica]|uniref:diguanylate cyclase n=1 Tax=Sulfurimonas autotrophica (strain ATCC BAA-671 / DSM 16294 / JCM 11897 / OK10) TaxID=563040 RepID=E0UTS8_SULAO|nr:sensor domain-containing diguanylate cyclase [Sulfurimonas autotrophica]ADN09372.1 diguanylate cyclase [Sulfurimonas autotrophica DSM 16294]